MPGYLHSLHSLSPHDFANKLKRYTLNGIPSLSKVNAIENLFASRADGIWAEAVLYSFLPFIIHKQLRKSADLNVFFTGIVAKIRHFWDINWSLDPEYL
jgi:hypothetical protein